VAVGMAVGGGGRGCPRRQPEYKYTRSAGHRQHRLSTQVLRLDRPRVYSRTSICCIFRPFSEPRLSVRNFSKTSPSFWGPNQSVARFSARPQNFRRLHFTASSCCVRCIDTGGPLVPSSRCRKWWLVLPLVGRARRRTACRRLLVTRSRPTSLRCGRRDRRTSGRTRARAGSISCRPAPNSPSRRRF
jgi:hypothetical protein